jgi:hypothetical protein
MSPQATPNTVTWVKPRASIGLYVGTFSLFLTNLDIRERT